MASLSPNQNAATLIFTLLTLTLNLQPFLLKSYLETCGMCFREGGLTSSNQALIFAV